MIKLKPYQQKGHDKLIQIFSKGQTALETSGTGYGKMYVSCFVAKTMGFKLAVVCPKIIIPTWKQVAEEAGVETVFVLNYEKIRTGKSEAGSWARGKRHFEWNIPDPATLLVFDEAHKMKNAQTKNGLLGASASKIPCKKLFVSATLCRDPRELKAVGLCLNLFNNDDFFHWCIKLGVHKGVFAWEFRGTQKELQKLHDTLAPWMHRERTEDIEGFPKNQVEAMAVETGHAKQIDKYIKALMEKKEDDEQLPIVQQLRERQEIELLKVGAITEMTKELVDEGKSVVIFINFRDTMAAIKHSFPDAATISGDQVENDRQAGIELFQNNQSHVIICQTQAGGVGLSLHDLQGRQRVSLISPTWSAIDLIQALGRINRSGAKSPAIQKIIFAAGSMEERVRSKVQAKCDQIAILNDRDLGYD